MRSIVSYVSSALVSMWRARKVWNKPGKARILIFDRAGSEELLPYIAEEDVAILDVRWESLNVPVLLKCALALRFSFQHYISRYVSHVAPAVAITFIDNNLRFLGLKTSHPDLTTVFVQNGWRTEVGDIFGHLRNMSATEYEVDYMLTFGSAVGNKYREYVAGEVVPIGSLKNNRCIAHVAKPDERSVTFISQFRPHTPETVCLVDGAHIIRWRDFYAAERKVLDFLSKYCERFDLKLQICGVGDQAEGAEYEFFRGAIGMDPGCWKFIPNSGNCDGYNIIDRSEIVVFVDTTLGYEALARGKKCAAFSIRGEALHNATTNFGWPAALPDSGPFWTNNTDEREFERILNLLITMNDAEWHRIREQYVLDLIEFDPGNSRLKALLQRLDVSAHGNHAVVH